jgi:hypothetical protein
MNARFRSLFLGTAAALLTASASAETPAQAYQEQLDNYHRQQQQYLYQRERYDERLDQYEYDRTHPRWWWRAAYFNAAPRWYLDARYDDLIGAEVDERDGLRVGQIANVERGPDGRVERVEVTLHDNRVAWVDAFDIRYDGRDRIAFVGVGPSELYARSHDRSYDYRP